MTKQEEKRAMKAMTKRLHEIEEVIDTGGILKTCCMCKDVNRDCSVCLAHPCDSDEDSIRRGLLYSSHIPTNEHISLAKAHHRVLVNRIKAKGYVYE